MTKSLPRVVGVGALESGDDALGLHAAELLRTRLPDEIHVLTDTSGGANIPALCEDTDVLVLVDAAEATPAFPPGSIFVLEYPAQRSAFLTARSQNTHSFSVLDGLDLAGRLGILPQRVSLCGMAGEKFEPCTPLSRTVRVRLGELVERVCAEIGFY